MLDKLEKLIQEGLKLDSFWPGFQPVAFAFYDKQNVYLFNHSTERVFQRNDQFNGETLILFEDYPTAIVNLEFHETEEELYSILVHELFHGYQYLKGEKRFPDEILGISYPVEKENIELRNQERMHLYQSVIAESFEERMKSLQIFISLREKRKSFMGEFIQYEALIESVEGPAWYIESKALFEKSSQSYSEILKKYGSNLLDESESTLNMRRSCYTSGLFICLWLDEILPDWKKSFLDTDITLFDFLKKAVDIDFSPIEEVLISKETEEIFDYVKRVREKEFTDFNNKEGYHLIIEGEFKRTMLDPMNIVRSGNKLLHKSFLKIRIHEDEYFIQQPVVVEFGEKFSDIHKLHLILNEKPIQQDGFLLVDGVGRLNEKYINIYRLSLI